MEVRYKFYSMVMYHPLSQLQHHKFMIVDGKHLVTGSYNWSDTAEWSNYENIVVFWGRKPKPIIEEFQKEFDKLWDMNRRVYAPFLENLRKSSGEEGYRRIVPVHFETDYFPYPMTLTRKEIAPIRYELANMGFFGERNNKLYKYFDRETGKPVPAEEAPEGTFIPAPPEEAPEPARGGRGITDVIDERTRDGR